MSFLTFAQEAQLHRETYIAVLNSFLKTRGSKRELAARVGITPQYLSYLLERWGTRTPSAQLAESIIASLSLSLAQKHALLTHMLLANERRLQARDAIHRRLCDGSVDGLLHELKQERQQASFSHDYPTAKRKYRLVYESGKLLLDKLGTSENPLAFAELCIIVHDASCVLGRKVDALWYAKKAHFILENLGIWDNPQEQEVLDLRIESIRSEAVSYHILRLPRQAYDYCEEAEALLETSNFKYRHDFWKPHLYRDKINILSKMPRFAITEAEGLAGQVEAVCDKDVPYTEDEKELLLFLVHSSLSGAYIQRGGKRNWRKADRLLRAEFERMGRMGKIGPLHQTLLLKTYARLRWSQGDQEEWRYFIGFALDVALRAGLEHQISEIRREYGVLVESLL